LAPNPSHLETVGAVIEGITRANKTSISLMIFKSTPLQFTVMPLLQGIIHEIVQMALDGYKTGGTIYIVTVGFTTNYLDALIFNLLHRCS
jgi:2-oxoglutarate dehydrogenase E1 component